MDSIVESGPPSFIGRTAFLQSLHATLQTNRCVAISGPAGCGKTALAHEYARRYAGWYQEIHGMPATTWEIQLSACLELVSILHLPLRPEQRLSSVLPLVREWLATHDGYLFILDNVCDPRFVAELLPPKMAGSLLLLTAFPDPPLAIPVLRLKGLEAEEGARLLLRQSQHTSALTARQPEEEQCSEAVQLAHALHGLPRALQLARQWVMETGSTFSLFHQRYQAELLRTPEVDATTPTSGETLRAVYSLALHVLAANHPLALTMLRFCALLAPEAIPLALFCHGLAASCRTAEELAANSQAFERASEILLAYGLIEQQGSPQLFRIPPQLQSLLLEEMTQAEQSQRARDLLSALWQMMPASYAAVPTRSHLYYLGHIRQVASYGEQLTFLFKEAAEVFFWASEVLSATESFAEAAQFLQRSLVAWEAMLGAHAPLVMALQHKLAALYEHLERYSEAEELLHRVITASAQMLGTLHLDTITSLSSLGMVYEKQHKWESAEATYQKALQFCERGSNPAHPLTLTIQYHLALVYLAHQQWSQAAPLLQQVYEHWTSLLGPEHEQTIRAQQALALIAIGQQQWSQAESLLRPTHDHAAREGGSEQDKGNPLALLLALTCIMQEKWDEAEQWLLLKSAQPDQDDLEAAEIFSLRAQIALQMEHQEQALTFLQHAIEHYERLQEAFRPDYTEYYVQFFALCVQLGNTNRVAEAADKLQKMLEKRVAARNPEGIVGVLNLLAILYLGQQRLEEADRLLQCAVEINEYTAELQPDSLLSQQAFLTEEQSRR